MAKRYRTLVIIVALPFIYACMVGIQPPTTSAKELDPSFGRVPPLAAGMGRIWIYRTVPKGLGLPPDIVVDDKKYDPLLPGTAYRIDVQPGVHRVMLAYSKNKLEIEVTAGNDAFVRFDLDPALFGRGFYPVLVDRNTAKAELRQHTGTNFDNVQNQPIN